MRALATGAVAVALLAGCGGSGGSTPRPAIGTFVGRLAGTDAYVAVVAGKENVVAYVCDGGHGIAELFTGRRSGGHAGLTSPDGAGLSVSLGTERRSGTVTLPGEPAHDFAAAPARGNAGFYHLAKKPGRRAAGWVVLNDGHQRGSLPGSRVVPATSTASLPGGATVPVSFVTPTIVSAAQFQGFGGKAGGFTGG